MSGNIKSCFPSVSAAAAASLTPVYKTLRLDGTTFSGLKKGWDGGLDPASM
jgi:hypothetical protein